MVCKRHTNLGRGVAVKADAPPRSSPWLLLLKTKQRVHSPAARRPITRATLPQTTDPSWRCWRCWPLHDLHLCKGVFVLRNCLCFTSCSPCRLTVRRQPHHRTHLTTCPISLSLQNNLLRLTYLHHRHSSLPPSRRYLSGTHHSSSRQPYTKRGSTTQVLAGAHARKWDSTLPHFTHHQTLHRFRCLHIHLLVD